MSGGGNSRSGLELMADREPCAGPCDVCALFEPIGQDRDAWKARVRAALDAQWGPRHARCIDCGTTERPHMAHGRCGPCDSRWLRHRAERPTALLEKEKAS